MTSSVVGVVGLVVAGMTNLVNVKFKAEYDKVEYRDGHIYYSVNVKDMTDKEYLMIYPSRDSKKLDGIKLEDSDGDGIIEGSFEVDTEYIERQKEMYNNNINIKYVLDLRGMVGLDVERLFDRWVVRIEEYNSYFENIEGHCTCSEDGYYHFKMNFQDDAGLFSNFNAYIYDAFYLEAPEEEKANHIAYCTFSDNLHEEQKIFVLDLQGSRGPLVVEYTKDGVDEPMKVSMDVEF